MLAARRMMISVAAPTAPTFIAATSSASSSSGVTSKTESTPTCQVGDRLLWAIESYLNPPSAAPTGWTLVTDGTHSASGRSTNGADDCNLNVYQRTADSTDAAGTSYTVNFAATSVVTSAMMSYRGDGGVDVVGVTATNTIDSASDTPSVTTTQANDVIVSIWGRNYSNAVNAANSAPAGTTQRAEAHSTSFDGVLVADEVQATAGATTSRRMNVATTCTDVAIAIALKGI